MKKLFTLILLFLFAITCQAQTTTEMLAWMNDNSSKINLAESKASSSFYFVKSVTFDKNNVMLQNTSDRKAYVGWASFDKVIQNGKYLTLQDLNEGYYITLSISDPEYLKKYIEYINKCAYAKLNITAEDGTIYNKTQVSQPAAFPGGEEGWNKLLIRSFNHAPAFKYDVPPGTYESEISFVVTERGFLKDFHRITNNPKGIEDCLLLLIYRKSQPWIPAQINGKNVASRTSVKLKISVPLLEDPAARAHYKDHLDLKLNMANY